MSGLNRYYRHSHIGEKKFRLLIRYFAMDLSASQTALLSALSRRSVNSIFLKPRLRLFTACQAASPFNWSEVEVDESIVERAGFVSNVVAALRANTLSSVSTNATVLCLPKSCLMFKEKPCKR